MRKEEINPGKNAIRYHICEKDENLVLSEQEVQTIAEYESAFKGAEDGVDVINDYKFIINYYSPLSFLRINEAGSSTAIIIPVKFCPNCGKKVYYGD